MTAWYEIAGQVEKIDANLRAADGPLHPTVIDSCMENVNDLHPGFIQEDDPDVFWPELLRMLESELDAEGYNADGTLR